jgi:hypothetical protein
MKKYGFLPGINKKPQYIEFSFNHHLFDNIKYDNINQIWISILKILINRDGDKYKDFEHIDDYLTFDYEELSIKEVKKFIFDNIIDEKTLDWLYNLQDLVDKFIRNYKKYLNSEIQYFEQVVSVDTLKDMFNNNLESNKIRTFKFFIEFEKFSEEFLNSIESLFSYSREELIINLKWDISLSTGEESVLNLFASLYNCIKTYGFPFQHINILMDEIEAYLHPNWQKQFIQLIINFFSLNGIKDKNTSTNIILTSHSPFILSDLPKENIIFLKSGKQVNVEIDTFGANIHTLLSHGFFMENGLMGDFAKGKINKVITYLNQKQLEHDEVEYCENIISIIGEPIIKRQLQKVLDSKRLSEIDNIKKQIQELQEKLAKKEDKK